MQLNELIEKEGIENVAAHTTISKANLDFLLNEEFEKLSRVKALGFLLILEREYKELEVPELRERIKLYFEEHKPDHDSVIVAAEISSAEGGVSFFKWFIILGILIGGWYLYSEGKLDGLVQNVVPKKDVLSDDKALENNVSMDEAKSISIVKTKDEPVLIVAPVEAKIDLAVEIDKEENKSISVFKKPIKVKEVVAQEVAQAEEVQSVVTQVVHPTIVPERELVIATKISTITINPTRGMLWFGFINVDTKKKKEFMKQVSTPFDINGGRWLLVTGHGFVDVVSELNTLEVSDSHKHYFYVDANELKEVSQEEFIALNDGHGWL